MATIESLRGTEADQAYEAPNVVHFGFVDKDPYEGLWSAEDIEGLFESMMHTSCGNVLPSDLKFISSEGPLDFSYADWDEAVRSKEAAWGIAS